MSLQPNHFYEFGPFLLNVTERLLMRNGSVVPLTPKAFDLLLVLVEHQGRLLGKDELMEAVWPDTLVEEGNLSWNISHLRKALADGEEGNGFIETLPKRGYRFVGRVRHSEAVGVNIGAPPQTGAEVARLTLGSLPEQLETPVRMAESVVTRTVRRLLQFDQARLAWVVAGLILLVLLAMLPLIVRKPVEIRAVRSFILPPEKSSFNFVGLNSGPITVSPDGRRIAFVATTAEGKEMLWVRSLDTLSAQALTGTEGASHPFWSWEGRYLGFFADGKLKKIDASGGQAIALCEARSSRGGAWSRDGVIVFSAVGSSVLHRISESGGTSGRVTLLDDARGELHHRWPQFLPDGDHFLYLGWGEGETGTIYVGSLKKQESKVLMRANSNVAYAQGYVLFLREGTLMAQPFDAKRMELAGEAFPIAEQIQYNPHLQRGVFSVSEQGVLAYQTGTAASDKQLAWFDRNGKLLGVLGDLAPYLNPQLSPDAKRVAVTVDNSRTARPDIWLYDVARNFRTRFTFDAGAERVAIWSPDGSRLIYNSDQKGHHDLYQREASGGGREELVLESNYDKHPISWSQDGRFLLYHTITPKTKLDLWILPLTGDQKPFSFTQTEFIEAFGRFSPDGSWIVYESDESQRNEIYVAAFPGPGGKRQISTSGGRFPRWRGDGKEIFFLAPDNKLMAAEVSRRGATLEVGTMRALFEAHQAGPGTFYDVTSDGQRFLVTLAAPEKSPAPITLVLNWTADLKR